MAPVDKLLSLRTILPAQRPHWVGDGFNVFPVFGPHAFQNDLSPWLMFDYAAPKDFEPTQKRRGVGQHPHRGFETVTIAYQGEVEHKDSMGGGGVIGTGDVQWMTAGRGILHEEYHSTEFAKKGGTFEMCQLWLNLPAKYKMHPPRYQAILSKDIPTVSLPDARDKKTNVTVSVIAGSLFGTKGPAKTFSPVELWDVNIPVKDSTITLPIPPNHTVIVFVRRGGILVGNQKKVGPQGVAIMESEGGGSEESEYSIKLKVTSTDADTAVLVLGGEPLNEPIAARGPFVMNTREELMQANEDFYSGRMGL